MPQNNNLTKLRQVRFDEKIDTSINEWSKRARRTITGEIQYRMDVFEKMLQRGEIKEYADQ